MKPQTAFVGTNSAVHLHPEAAIDPDLPLIIQPWYPEENNPLWFNDPFEDRFPAILRILVQNRLNGFNYFANGLMKFLLMLISVCYERDVSHTSLLA